jgi:hypothetical protein
MFLFYKSILMSGRRVLIFIFLLFFSNLAFSQSAFWNLDLFSNHAVERLELKSGRFSNNIHSNLKPIARNQLGEFLDAADTVSSYSKVDKANISFLKGENWEYSLKNDSSRKGFLKYFFKKEFDFFHVANKDFDIHLSPVLNSKIGTSSAYGNLPSKTVLNNTRGFELRGSIGKKLGFYTYVTENIVNSPNMVSTYFNARGRGYPFSGLVKVAKDDFSKLNVDYFSAIGYIRFTPIKNIGLSFGHDRNFIGNGVRSMILSDFSVPYLNFKVDLKIGRLQFLNIISQMTDTQDGAPIASQFTYPPKFMVFHSLNLNLSPKFNIGFFEQVFFGKHNAGFELNYLNPIIFYRFLESNIGSSDNALVGIDSRLILSKSVSLYGQFNLDEYSKKEYKKDGSFSKKYAYQAGLKYLDVFSIKNLDFQFEYNYARPFMYSHFSSLSNAVNYNVPTAHPLGANFKELISVFKFQPKQKLFIQLTSMFALKGEDKDGLNYGGNIFLNYRNNKAQEYGNEAGQGFANNIVNTELIASYRIFSTIYIDATAQIRTDSYFKGKYEQLLQFGIRWNQPYRQLLF